VLTAKPFIKWVGGKTQLLEQFQHYYPPELGQGQIRRYVEPFLGGGAVFLDLAQRYAFQEIYLGDINPELVLVYRVVQQDPTRLLEHLEKFRHAYLRRDEFRRQQYFYDTRERYNRERATFNYRRYSGRWIKRAAQMIFLNKTCYNGLFRLNRSGAFNVPFGRYKEPKIFESDNIEAVSRLLQNAELRCGGFDNFTAHIDAHTLVYFDPPYRPLSATANFTAYSQEIFDDARQIALARYFVELDRNSGAKLMLSNSQHPHDLFFEKLFANYRIHHVYARRMVNSKASQRGAIAEILVCNF
jgi:DNA adenine methylase